MQLTVKNQYGKDVAIEFATAEMKNQHISPDNGQGMGATRTCLAFSCQQWVGSTPVYPVLLGGMSQCPRCGASYGEGNARAFA